MKSRVKSFAWRLGGLVVVAGLTFLLDPQVLDLLKVEGVRVPAALIVLGGLILGEVTKALNKAGVFNISSQE